MSYFDNRMRVLNEQLRLASMNNNLPLIKEAEARIDELKKSKEQPEDAAPPLRKDKAPDEPAPERDLSSDELENKKVKELKDICRDLGVEGYSTMKKSELVDILKSN